jgi:hypothetical protein
MRVTVEHCGGAESINWFFESAGTEKGINFGILALQGGANRRVMQDHDALLHLELHQRLLETNGMAD